jgi:16S rRNA (uracil1498-N3)-methyltransferase
MHVLRMRPGERLRLFDGTGREIEAEVIAVRGREVLVAPLTELPPAPPALVVHLYPALIRPQRFEWLLEKATELGVARVQPLVSERCQVRTAEFGAGKAARWRRIMAEAAGQCGRRDVPELASPLPFREALACAPGFILLPWEAERATAPTLSEALRAAGPDVGSERCPLAIFIGPEGGFSPAEVAAARGRAALTVSLGPRVLRAETAAVAALAIALDALLAVRRAAVGAATVT